MTNGGARLSIEAPVKVGKIGCLVNPAFGEILLQVEHKDHPFEVR
jgi:hypothetical protein